jgi:ribosomal protein S8E
MRKINFILIFSIIGIFSCTDNGEKDQNVLAIVGNKSLTVSTINDLLLSNFSAEDSIEQTKKLIDSWVLEQLLLEKALANLNDDEKDFSELVKSYENSLIIHKYKQKFIKQKLDTTVSQIELNEYYKMYSSKFTLKETIVKGTIIKVDVKKPGFYKVQPLRNSLNSDNRVKFEEFYKKNFEHWDFEKFVDIRDFIKPCPGIRLEKITKGGLGKYKDVWHGDGLYYVKLYDLYEVGETAPKEWVEEQIRTKIIDIRKQVLFMELNENLVERAKKIGHVKIK